MSETFRAVYAEQGEGKSYSVSTRELTLADLPQQPNDVLIEVACSSLNYKDGLAVTGRGKIIRKFPMVLGIDVAGTVLASRSDEFAPGDQVLAVGQGLGELVWGGYTQRLRVASDALVRLPRGLTLEQSMAIGTAGFTAMLAILSLERMGLTPGEREVAVTGASGGVGSLAVHLLSRLGYRVAASTGRVESHDYLRRLGATTLLERAELATRPPPLASERWAGAIDTVGGDTLATLIAQTASFGSVAACGMAGGSDLQVSVFPFILRNVNLLGVNSTQTPKALRELAWSRLAETVDPEVLRELTSVEPMSKIVELSERILAGQIRGRVVVDVNR